MNRNKRIIELVEGLDFDAVRKFVETVSEIVTFEDERDYHDMMKLIDQLQELESTVKGVPIK